MDDGLRYTLECENLLRPLVVSVTQLPEGARNLVLSWSPAAEMTPLVRKLLARGRCLLTLREYDEGLEPLREWEIRNPDAVVVSSEERTIELECPFVVTCHHEGYVRRVEDELRATVVGERPDVRPDGGD